jgi:5'-3' exonuclease
LPHNEATLNFETFYSRFRLAKEAEELEKKAKEKGEEVTSAARFDSNCITPGTPFMVRLKAQLKFFVAFKISTDDLWQKCKIILSGHEVMILLVFHLPNCIFCQIS